MEGWIKLFRSLLKWEWISSPNHLVVFIHLLLRANFRVTSWRGEIVSPGQLLTGRKQLAEWTGLSEMQIRTVLKDLKKSKEIEIKATKIYSIITIASWDLYQGDIQQVTNTQPHPKNAKNIINNISSSYTPDFFEGVIETVEKNLPSNQPQDFRNPKDSSLELVEDHQNSVHEKLASKGSILKPEWIVVEYYNKANKRNLKQVDSNYKQIKARLAEGFTVEEMKTLIDYTARVWSKDAFWRKFNVPSTLFNGKFNQYLEQALSEGEMSDAEASEIIRRELGWVV